MKQIRFVALEGHQLYRVNMAYTGIDHVYDYKGSHLSILDMVKNNHDHKKVMGSLKQHGQYKFNTFIM